MTSRPYVRCPECDGDWMGISGNSYRGPCEVCDHGYVEAPPGSVIVHPDDPVAVTKVWLNTDDNKTYALIAAAEQDTP